MTPIRLLILTSAASLAATLPAWPALAECPPGTVHVGEERVRESEYVIRVSPVCEQLDGPVTTEAMNESIVALAQRERWGASELNRLKLALQRLPFKVPTTHDRALVARTWEAISARTGSDWPRIAGKGDGPVLFRPGQQSFEDCTIFALATAAGRPYGFVAALATDLIGRGDWRNPNEQANPQAVIQKHGVYGGEVVMLAETLGRAEIVPPPSFASTLRGGRPVMIAAWIPGESEDGLHEMVLSRGFQHKGSQWFEIIDSNQEPQRRLYASAGELNNILYENGVSYRPDPGTIVRSLK